MQLQIGHFKFLAIVKKKKIIKTLVCLKCYLDISGADMQKSKSSSHVGQYVSSKLLKGQLRNPSKSIDSTSINSSNTSKVPKWFKSGKNSWSSETGERIVLSDTAFHILSDLETKLVQKICLEKITELNIGIELPGCESSEILYEKIGLFIFYLNFFFPVVEGKTHKRRLLAKKRAMTTSFFDIGKKDQNSTYNILI